MTGSVAGIRRRRTVAGRRETPHLPPDRDFYGQTLPNFNTIDRWQSALSRACQSQASLVFYWISGLHGLCSSLSQSQSSLQQREPIFKTLHAFQKRPHGNGCEMGHSLPDVR